VDDEYLRRGREKRDRREVPDGIVWHVAQHVHVDGVRRIADEKRVAVGRRLRNELAPERPRRAGPVVDDELLPEYLSELLSEDPRHRIG
jgi:hypothetical protein